MKRIFLVTVLTALVFTAACGKRDNNTAPPSESEAAVSASPAASGTVVSAPPAAGADNSGAAAVATPQPDSTNIERLEGSAVSGKVVDEGIKEKTFVGGWRSVSTTSDNAAFTFLELQITEDDYLVTLTFDDGSSTSYQGTYEIHDGVLKFDDSFIGCTAYFYDDDESTLIVDNGTSLVLCEHLETEEEMEATKRSDK